jgi:outer membrane lipoprotein-sorting protein
MKHYRIGIIVLLLAVFLAGCSANKQAVILDDVSFGNAFDSQNTFVLADVAELQAHMDTYNAKIYSESYAGKLKAYEEAFFQTHRLAVIYYTDPTVSSTLSVKEIQYSDGQANVILNRKTPDIVSDMIKNYVILVEIPQEKGVTSVTYDIEGL